MSVTLRSPGLWQPGFFDHVLRSDESYAEKWNDVRENPVRALVQTADDWPYQSEIALQNDCSRHGCLYTILSQKNLKKVLPHPWELLQTA
jgi:hypothetical protein